MANKKIIAGISCGILILAAVYGAFMCRTKEVVQPREVVEQPAKTDKQPVKPTSVIPKKEEKKVFDLYSSTPYDLPLISVLEISKLSPQVKKSVDEVLSEAQGFYLLRFNKSKNKVFVILQNPITASNTYSRHDLEFVEISHDGAKKFHKAGYTGVEGETSNAVEQDNDVWEFDKSVEPHRPLKHVAYDEKGNVKFTEVWNYDSDSGIKYEMKDSAGKPLSILKETVEDGENYRKEHIFYDKDGNTKMSLSANYDGANVSRFTYYDSSDDVDSISIISEFSEGLKTGEKVYNENYELINSVKTDYENGDRKDIRLYDDDGKEVDKISS